MSLLLFASAIVLAILLVFLVPSWWQGRPSARVEQRLRSYVREVRMALLTDGPILATEDVFNADERTQIQRLRRLLSTKTANIGGRPAVTKLLMYSGVAGFVSLGVGVVWLRLDAITGFGLAFVAGSTAMLVTYYQLKRRWQIAFLNNLADAIDLVVRAVRSGIPVSEAIRTAGQEINDPVRSEFQRISNTIDLGIDLREALREAGARIRLPDFDFFVITLVIQSESGGQLAETLEGLSLILRRRKELRLKIRAMTAEGRMSALIVGGMPILTGLGSYLMAPEHVGRLLEPGTGQTMLYIAISMMALGMLVTYQLTKVKP